MDLTPLIMWVIIVWAIGVVCGALGLFGLAALMVSRPAYDDTDVKGADRP